MGISEFQLESKPVEGISQIEKLTSWLAPMGSISETAVASLLIGLKLRGWLADSEKDLLDRMAAENYLTFLADSESYLHPEGTGLFPIETIEAAQSQGSDALFRSNYHPDDNRCRCGSIIHSAVVNPGETNSLIIGFFGPDPVIRRYENDNHFARVVETLRAAYSTATDVLARLTAKLHNNCANILINRCSGRIVYADKAATALLGRDERSLVDLEYTGFKESLAPVLISCKLKFENIEIDDNRFILISLGDAATQTYEDDPRMARHFIHKLRNKISGITTASSYLGSLLDGRADEEELAKLILAETAELNNELSRFNYLLRYDELPQSQVNPFTQLERAIDRTKTVSDEDCQIDVITEIDSVEVKLAGSALYTLFESVLGSHLSEQTGRSQTEITVSLTHDNTMVTMNFVTGFEYPGSTPAFDTHWRAYCRNLADAMSIDYTTEVFRRQAILNTTLVIPM